MLTALSPRMKRSASSSYRTLGSKTPVQLGLDAKKSEVHGFAQRGGVVESHIRWAQSVGSPTCEYGTVDVLMSFELLEAARWLDWLKPGGTVIVNRQQIEGFPLLLSTALYPEWPLAKLRHVPDDLAVRVAIALMQMPADDPAARAGQSSSFR